MNNHDKAVAMNTSQVTRTHRRRRLKMIIASQGHAGHPDVVFTEGIQKPSRLVSQNNGHPSRIVPGTWIRVDNWEGSEQLNCRRTPYSSVGFLNFDNTCIHLGQQGNGQVTK